VSIRVLVIFGGTALYGMERGVIEIFDLLRPEVDPHFLISHWPRRLGLPLFDEIEKRKFDYSFLSDSKGWERLGKPRSFSHLYKMLVGLLRGNLDALREVRRHDMLYVANLFAAYYVLLAMFYCRLKGRRVIYHFHDLYSCPSRLLRFVSFFVTDFVHNTSYGQEVVRKSNPFVDKAKNWIIPCPIVRGDTPEVSNGDGYFEEKGRHIIFVGQVALHKGVDVLLDAVAMLSKDTADLTLHIVGGCTDPDLESRIMTASNNSQARVRYWGYRDDVLQMMKSADVYVHPSPPSLQESLGRGVLEAMSVGTPTVCFKSGALQELVINEETGLTCDEDSAECLAAGIKRLLVNNDLRRRCGGFALRRYAENYSNPRVKALWLNCLGANQEVTD
jgi:glycosyltransferase involved in cell wall biosynthesis